MQAGDLRTDSDHSLASYLESFSPIYYLVRPILWNFWTVNWLISIESSFSKALEGYAMYNTWKQEICSHLSYGFPSSKSLVIVNRGTLCKSCSASYNIAINIANNNFSYVSKTLRVSCFSVERDSPNSFPSLSGDEIVHYIPQKCFLFLW